MKPLFALVLLCLLACSRCGLAGNAQPELLTPAERAWLAQHPDIVLGVGQEWMPWVVKRSDGEVTGFAAEHIALLNQKLGTSMRLEAGPWHKMVEKALALKLAGLTLMANLPERKAQFLLTDVFHTAHVFIYLRGGERPDASGLAAFEGKKVGYMKGILRLSRQLAAYPGIVAVPLESNESLAKGLLDGSLDAVVGAYDLEYWRTSHGVLGFSPTRIVPDLPPDETIGVRKDWPELQGILNKGLAAITPDEMAELYRRWFGSEYLQRVEDVRVSLTADEQAWLAAHPRVVLGTVVDQPPALIVRENGDLSGILVDYVKLLNRRLGIDIQIALDTWPNTLKKGAQREVDLVGFVFPLDAHRPYFDFTQRILSAYYSIYVREADAHPPQSLAGLAGQRVGYIAASRIVEQVAGRQAKLDLVPFVDNAALVKGLLDRQVDAAIHNAAFDYWRKQHSETGFKLASPLPEMGGDLVFGVRKDWSQLTDILNKGLASIGEEERMAILNRWLGSQKPPKPELPTVALTDEERAWIKAHPVLRAGFDPDWAPIEFADEKGRLQGISMAYLDRLETLLGLRFERVRTANWEGALQGLQAGALDVLPATTVTPERKAKLHFTQPYLSFPASIFSASQVTYLDGLPALSGKNVAVIRNEAAQEWLRTDWPKLDLVQVADTQDALSRMAKGQVFAFVGNLATTSYYVGQSGLTQTKVVGETPYAYTLGMAVRQDWPILAGILQKGLDAILKPERDNIYHQWISIEYKHGVDYTLLWRVMAAAGLILFAVFYWNRKLAREVGLRREAESASRLAKEEADRANQAKSQLLSHVSHDLRTPLNAVLGFAQLLEGDGRKLAPDQQELVGGIRRGGERLLGLIDELLDLTKIEADRFEPEAAPWDTQALLAELDGMFRASALRKGLALSIKTGPAMPGYLFCDSKRLHQILANLLDNAVKYTDEGSVTLLAGHEGNRLTVEVIDTGIGIPAEETEHIFEPFQRLDAASQRSKGIGLGLAITNRLVECMGGAITVESTPGQGSQFRLWVPAEAVTGIDEQMQGLQAAVGAVYRRFQGDGPVRILIVDDEPDNRQLLRRLLEPLGLTVREVGNGKSCLEMVEDWKPDLIFMDLLMPEMDGLETTRALRANPSVRDIPVVAVTAANFAEDLAKSQAAGCDAHLCKPIFKEALLATLENCLPLEWRYPEANDGSALPSEVTSLSQEQRERLIWLIEAGDMAALIDFAEALGQEGRYPLMAERIKTLTKAFDLEGLGQMLVKLRVVTAV